MQADKDAPLLGGLLAVTASTVDEDANVAAADDDAKGEREAAAAEEEDWWSEVVVMVGVSASLSSRSLRRRVLACPVEGVGMCVNEQTAAHIHTRVMAHLLLP